MREGGRERGEGGRGRQGKKFLRCLITLLLHLLSTVIPIDCDTLFPLTSIAVQVYMPVSPATVGDSAKRRPSGT